MKKTIIISIILASISLGMAIFLPINKVYVNQATLYNVYRQTLNPNDWDVESEYMKPYMNAVPRMLCLMNYQINYQDVWYNYSSYYNAEGASRFAAEIVKFVANYTTNLFDNDIVGADYLIGMWWLVSVSGDDAYILEIDSINGRVKYIGHVDVNR